MNPIQRMVLALGALALLSIVLFAPKFQRNNHGAILPAGSDWRFADQIDYKAVEVRGVSVALVTVLLWLTFNGIKFERVSKKHILLWCFGLLAAAALIGFVLYYRNATQALLTKANPNENGAQAAVSNLANQPAATVDPAEAILRPLQQVDTETKRIAWDVFHNTDNEALFTERLNQLNLTDDTKIQLWHAKWDTAPETRIQADRELRRIITKPSPESVVDFRPPAATRMVQPPRLTQPSVPK